MVANAVVRARIDEETKEEAAAILKASGLSLSDAIRMMLIRTVAERSLPFDPLVPNEATIAAMLEARRGNLPSVDSIDDLMKELDA